MWHAWSPEGAVLEFIAGDMLDSFLVYFGLTLLLAGLVSLIWPLRFLEIRTRRMAAMVAAGGLLLFVMALALPVSANAVTTHTAKLDDWMPRWQIRERHIIPVAASPEKVFAAIHAVRADDIFLFRTLIAIRQCGQTGPESIMNAPEQKPILDVATQTTFVLLAEEPPRELVIGTVVAAPPKARASGRLTPELFQKKLQPGVALATMNFLVTPDDREARPSPPRRAFTRTTDPPAPVCDLLARHSSWERHHPQNVAARDQAARGRIGLNPRVRDDAKASS